MELILSAVCETADVRADGKLDLHGAFSQLQAPGFPASQDAMTAVFVLEWAPEDAGRQPLRADLLDDAGQKIVTIQGHTEVAEATPGDAPPQTRLIMPLERIVFPHAGTYRFQITAGPQSRRGCSLHVAEAGAG